MTKTTCPSDGFVPHQIKNLLHFFTAIVPFLWSGSFAFADTPPNIVFILADDLGYADLGCYGHPHARTPAIDQLAREGTRFTQHYVTGVTCNPSRTGLMTGLFPARFSKYTADFGFGERTTITEMLKAQGYATGHFGKWHIGPKSEAGTYGLDMVDVIGKSRSETAGRDDDLTTAAIEFIKTNKESPFYVNIWGHATHFPVDTAEGLASEFSDLNVNRQKFSATMQHKFDESFQINMDLNQSMRQYLGDVYQIDLNVDRILKTIEELGLRENTIVVFSSDHGPAPVLHNKKKVRKYSKNMLGYAGEFRGGKHTQFEGGTRVPFIVRWPGHVKAGRIDTENITSFIDWLPTLAAIAGVQDLPQQLDGEDISMVWFGEDRKRVKPLYWKTSAVGSSSAMRDGDWKLHHSGRNKKTPVELYNLLEDASESRNIAAQHPEVVKQMTAQLEEWVAELPTRYEKTGEGKRED
ncbi:Arylsulfatase [Polystyrenella longa]|uniref:Arylsulfatase n=1 Tax=Polystyrenella longa TaxID=2528007 RepID=A0A518CNG6_9PLAN|nr:sulfatase-like hydrolase/transferase [Polystyrenella longa]QDU80772.1 Arylsulfatase [Polystyrenella longa]